MTERSVHVIVSGRVQGVGYRAWVAREAAVRQLAGWVRNRADGTVEAVLAGANEKVDDMIGACRSGPPAALVADVAVNEAPAPPSRGFAVLPTA